MSPRVFAAVAGGVLMLAGLIVLLLPATVTADMVPGIATEQVRCGTALAPADQVTPEREAACRDALGTPQGFGWGLGGVGVLVLAGALVIRTQRRQTLPQGHARPPGYDPYV